MGVTPSDAEWDEGYSRLYDEVSEEAITQYKRELSFDALKKMSPDVARVHEVIAEAERVRSVSPAGTVLFSASAVEITLKKLILEPLVVGLIHNEEAAPLITRAIIGNHALRHAKELAAKLLLVAAEFDLEAYKRNGATLAFMSEAQTLASQRDGIIHRGDRATDKNAEHALVLANEMLTGVFGEVLWSFDLRLVNPGDEAKRDWLYPEGTLIVNTQGRSYRREKRPY